MMIRKAWRTVDYSVLQAIWLHSTTEKYVSRSDNAHRCVRCKILIYFSIIGSETGNSRFRKMDPG